MLKDGLFERFPKPDFVIGIHDDDTMPAGHDRFSSGTVSGDVDFADGHDVRTRWPRRDAVQHHRPGGHGRAHRDGAADGRIAREQPDGPGRRDDRIDPRRHAGQCHPRRSEAGAEYSHLYRRGAEARPRRRRADRQGRGVGGRRATRAVDHDARVGPRRRERSCVDEASGRGAAEGDGHAAGQSRCRRR